MSESSPTSTTAGNGQGRYRFVDLIATGGMGEVWRAYDNVLSRDVAIKLLKPEYAADRVNRARFDSEAQNAASLHHPNIAAVYDMGEMPTASGLVRPYLVMEYVDGRPLSDLIAESHNGLPDEQVRSLLAQAGDAIASAHRAGIVHRDIKPANLLVTADGRVKVTDFGIARAAGNESITTTGQVMGTPQYLSPEQARGEVATPASDVYSLGVVAFECLTGKRPFEKETPVATAIAQIYDPVPPLPDTVPADLRDVVMTALAKDPADRYPDAAAFTAALRGVEAARTDTPISGIQAVITTTVMPRTTVVPPPPAAAPTQVVSLTPDEIANIPSRSRNWLTIALLVALSVALIAVLLLAFWVFHGTSPTSNDPTDVPTSDPTQTSSGPVKPINLKLSDYQGKDIDTVTAALQALNLQTNSVPVTNDGHHKVGAVFNISPTVGLLPGAVVTVRYYTDPITYSTSPTTSTSAAAPTTSSAPTTSAAPPPPTTSAAPPPPTDAADSTDSATP